ncbi:MAG TPA: biotin/lipoate--protein ligase family protein [Xanthobacteraceae bacterium]|nr:biotin/lipoate--protein ligase family protein [Xanthobacteraceae bacterium]
MQRERRSRIREPYARALDLPPPFRLVVLREVGDAFAHARAHAAELGAGTLVFVGRSDLAEFAVVLEPDEPLASARRAFYACMVALSDALAASAPPEKPIDIEWPDAIYVDRGLIGGGRLAWPDHADERAVPDWLVFGASIRTLFPSSEESGLYPLSTALEAESFGDFSAERLVEGFARHLMVAVDRWQERGFTPIAQEYISKLKPEGGVSRNIAENGDFGVRRAGELIEHRHLLPALTVPSWLDPRTSGPRL